MATNIPPHNLGEVIDGCLAMIENPAITVGGADRVHPRPRLPDRAADPRQRRQPRGLHHGARLDPAALPPSIEEGRGERRSIVLTSIPYQVGKAGLVEKIAEAAKDKRIEGVSDIRDESNREGRARGPRPQARRDPRTWCSTSCGGTPRRRRASGQHAGDPRRPARERSALRDILQAFIQFREQVITRRTKFELNKARDRATSCSGWWWPVSHLDEVVAMIRGSSNPAEARSRLLGKEWPVGDIAPYLSLVEAVEPDLGAAAGTYRLSEVQVKAILDLRLHRLTALGRDEIGDELKDLAVRITEYLAISPTEGGSTRSCGRS
jgi:DNA gyrase subunit A